MTTPTTGAFAIIPCNDLHAALVFWQQLGFTHSGGEGDYIIVTGWQCELHLTRAEDGLADIHEGNNPFGIFIRTPDVDKIAALAGDFVIRPGGVPGHREWGIYEVGIAGPEGLLVRAGWPSRLISESGEHRHV